MKTIKLNRNFYGFTAVALATLGLASCSNELNEPGVGGVESPAGVQLVKNPNILAWSGSLSLNNTTGYMSTRSVDTWDYQEHDHPLWVSALEFELPSNYVTLTKDNATLRSGNTYYMPSDFDGIINFDNFNGDLYIDGEVSQFYGNPGNVTVYIFESGAWKAKVSTGTLNVYNRGELTLPHDALQNQNIKNIYNAGEFTLGNDTNGYNDISNGVSIFSNGGHITFNGTTDLKATCDIHNTLESNGNLKIQNGNTQYICGLIVDELLDMTQGKLETSYIDATEIKFDGSNIWLLPQGHIVADKISMTNSATHIFGASGSFAYIETKDFYLRNKNNFADSFSGNIYFNVTGQIDIEEIITSGNGQNDNVTNQYTVNEYIVSQNGEKVADRFKSNIKGTSACGGEYGSNSNNGDNNVDGIIPDAPAIPNGGSEVEVNLSINDKDNQGDIEHLISKLSIHVRYPNDVKITIPVPKDYYVAQDDLYILNNHEDFVYGGESHSVNYNINGHIVTLSVDFQDDQIVVTTSGIDEEVFKYCVENYSDGVNFEIYNYFNYMKLEDGDLVVDETKDFVNAAKVLKSYLDRSIIEFIDNNGELLTNPEDLPNYYINAFNDTDENVHGAKDCWVNFGNADQAGSYDEGEKGAHLNNGEDNIIFEKDGVNDEDDNNQHNHDFLWKHESVGKE